MNGTYAKVLTRLFEVISIIWRPMLKIVPFCTPEIGAMIKWSFSDNFKKSAKIGPR